jgi:hypothetical protein
MREFVRAGEVAAILGLDSKVSAWAIWNRMTEDEKDSDISDRSLWQGRLASEIAAGIAKDHGIKLSKALEPKVGHGIMPPRAWEVAPHARTGGKKSILVVLQRTQQSLFGWEAPAKIPEKQLMRFLSAAVAYEYSYVHVGILIDGYRSELYRVQLDEETKAKIITKVEEMIQMVKDDDEPVVDYAMDNEAIREGRALVKATQSSEQIEALLAERQGAKTKISRNENEVRALKQRVDQIDTMIIASIPEGTTLDIGNTVLSTERNNKDKLILKVASKATDATSLF